MYAIENINQNLLKRYLKRVEEPLVLDIDASVIKSHKSTVAYTYKMFPGFTPMIGHINGGYIIHSEFRSGNIAPADHNLTFIQRCEEQLPKEKKTTTPILPGLEKIFSEEKLLAYASERYHVIATNADEDKMSTQDIVMFYRKRGDTSENRIKELKNGFNLKYLPPSDFIANAFYFQIGVLAYNLFILFKETLCKSWQKHTIETLRYKLYNIAGKLITHSRQTILKVNKQFIELLEKIRKKSYEISLE